MAELLRRRARPSVLLVLVATAALIGFGRGDAAVLAPALVDANTGHDALDVGAAMGNHRAWAGFTQQTGGNQRLYAAYAQDGVFASPKFVDQGNPVVAAALAGNANGDAIAAFTETVAGKGVLFARRLANGQPGPVAQVSTDGQDVQLASVHHRHVLAENASGAAVVFYHDNADNNQYAAILATGGNAWTKVGPLKNTTAEDAAIDSRGNSIVLGDDIDGHPAADRIVNGVLHSEEIDSTGKDEPSVAVTPGGLALAFARIDDGGDFRFVAYRKGDIAQDGAWTNLGRVDTGASLTGENTEYVRAALTGPGNGVLSFRVNHPPASRIYAATITAGQPGAAKKLSDVDVGQDAIPNVDASGNGLVVYNPQGPDGKRLPTLRFFASGTPGAALPLDGGTGKDVEALDVPSVVTDGGGNFLAVLRQDNPPLRTAAVFGDFGAPTLHATATPSTTKLGQSVALASGAADSFAAIPATGVTWTLAAGSVAGATTLNGLDVSLQFIHPGLNQVTVAVVDRGGNTATQTLAVTVSAPLLKAAPKSVRRRHKVAISGGGFIPGRPVRIQIRRPHVRTRTLKAKPNANGGFRVRYAVPKKAARGKYTVVACQLACTVQAKASYKVKR